MWCMRVCGACVEVVYEGCGERFTTVQVVKRTGQSVVEVSFE